MQGIFSAEAHMMHSEACRDFNHEPVFSVHRPRLIRIGRCSRSSRSAMLRAASRWNGASKSNDSVA